MDALKLFKMTVMIFTLLQNIPMNFQFIKNPKKKMYHTFHKNIKY